VTTGGAAVLWDVDGTLLSAGPAPKEALRQAVRSTVGMPVELAGMQMGGLTDRRIVVEILDALGVPSDAATVAAVLDAYVAQLRSDSADLLRHVQVPPGVLDVLHGLADRGVRQLVVTGNARTCAELKLDAAGLAGFFDPAEGGFGDDLLDKADVAADVLASCSDAAEVWLVGDTPRDLQCARSVGISCLLVATGRYDLATLTALGPERALQNLADAREVVLGLAGAWKGRRPYRRANGATADPCVERADHSGEDPR